MPSHVSWGDSWAHKVAQLRPVCASLASLLHRRETTRREEIPDRSAGAQLQTEPVNSPTPARGLRPGALLVSGVISAGGALLVLIGMHGSTDERVAASWALVQFLSGVWAGVLGANSPFLHGLVAGVPALVLGLLIA